MLTIGVEKNEQREVVLPYDFAIALYLSLRENKLEIKK